MGTVNRRSFRPAGGHSGAGEHGARLDPSAVLRTLRQWKSAVRSWLSRGLRRVHQLRPTKVVGLVLGPALLVTVIYLPTSLTESQHHLLALIVMTVTFWVFRALPIPVTPMLALALAVVFDVAPAQKVFGAFSSPTLFLLIGGFIITRAMIKHGLGRRIAIMALLVPGIAGSTYRIVIAFGFLAALLSGVMDNGVVAAMLLPIATGLLQTLSPGIHRASGTPEGEHLRFGTALMLITAYGATVGALTTPFGDASNLVGWQFIRTKFGEVIPVLTWVTLAVPIVLVLFTVLCAAVLLTNRPEVGRLPEARQRLLEFRAELGRMSRGELNTAIAFGTALCLWFMPPLVGVVTGYGSNLHQALTERLQPSVVAILAASLLFMLPVPDEDGFTLRWKDLTRLDWGPVFLMGSSLALGELMGRTGLAQVLGQMLASYAGGLGTMGVYLTAAGTALLISELTSNVVSISVFVPVLPALARAGGGDPLEMALIATFAAIYGFMLPISTSANAIVYASGKIPFWRMVRTGLIVDLSGAVVVVCGVVVMLRVVGIA